MTEYLNTLLGISFVCFVVTPGLYLSLGISNTESTRRRRTKPQTTAYQRWMYLTTLKNLQKHTEMAITPLPPIKTYEDVPYQPPLPSSRSGSEAGSQFDDVPRPTTSENDYEQLLIPQSANVEPILNGFFKAKAEEVYRVENILDYPVTEGIKEYLCKWKGYSDEDNSWEEYDVIKKAKKVLDAFHKRQKNNPAKEDAEQYYVDEILDDRRRKDGKTEYLIQWQGYGYDDDTWEPEDNLGAAISLINAYSWRKKLKRYPPDSPGINLDKVKAIFGYRSQGNTVLYLTNWKGYPLTENTWEPREIIAPLYASLLDRYHDKEDLPNKPQSPSHSSDEADDLPDEPESQSNSSDAADDGTEEMDPSVFEKLHSVTRHRGAGDTLQYRCQWTKYGTMKTWEPAKMLVTQDCGRIREYLSVALADDPKEVAAHARTLVAEIIDHRIGSDQTCEFEVRWRGESTPRPVWLTEAESWPLIEVISKVAKIRPHFLKPPACQDAWTPEQGHPAGTQGFPTTFILFTEVPVDAPYWYQISDLARCKYKPEDYNMSVKYLAEVRQPSPNRSIREDGRRWCGGGNRTKSSLLPKNHQETFSDQRTNGIANADGVEATMRGARIPGKVSLEKPLRGYNWATALIQNREKLGETAEQAMLMIPQLATQPLVKFLVGIRKEY